MSAEIGYLPDDIFKQSGRVADCFPLTTYSFVLILHYL